MKHLFYSESYDPIDPKNIRVQGVSNDKKQIFEIPLNGSNAPFKALLPAQVFQLLEERAKELIVSPEKESEDIDDSLYLAIETFLLLLEQLKKENVSENDQFAEKLSRAWLIANEHMNMNKKQRPPPTYYPKLKSFLQTLMKYPEKSDHTFGYYLNQYTGEKWLPFPFIDLLSKLHEDFLLLKEKSTLTKWTLSLKEILNFFIDS